MIGMDFESFLTLLILGFIAAVVLHYGARYRTLASIDGFIRKWIVGWIGAWLGSPVLGHWGPRIQIVYILPAIVGAFAGAFLATSAVKARAMAVVTTSEKTLTAQPEIRKAS